MRAAIVVLLGLGCLASPGVAQHLRDSRQAFAPVPDAHFTVPSQLVHQEEGGGVGAMLAAGAGAGMFGIVAGAFIGANLESCGPDEWFCGLTGGVVGAIAGSTIMIPLGVHGASARHSSLGAKFGASALMLGAAALLAYPSYGISMVVMPLGQLIATVRVEDKATRRAASVP